MADVEIPVSFSDCNLPELLACDLEKSSPVFLSKQLTAGAPLRPHNDDWAQRRCSLQDSPISPGSSSHVRQRPFVRVRSLEALDQQYARILDYGEGITTEHSEWETGSSGSSGTLEMLPSKNRPISPTTPATSVASERHALAAMSCIKPPVAPPTEKSPENSWIDMSEDGGEDIQDESKNVPRRHSTGHMPPSRPSQHHQVRRDTECASQRSSLYPLDLSESRMTPTTMTMNAMGANEPRTPEMTSRKKRPAFLPPRNSSLNHQLESSLAFTRPPLVDQLPSPTSYYSTESDTRANDANGDDYDDEIDEEAAPPLPFRSPKRDVDTAPATRLMERSKESLNHATEAGSEMPNSLPVREQQRVCEAVPTQDTIEDWLHSTLGSFSHYAQPTADGSGSRLPLPPDVLETLRVSVSCFPETMLLCSSLSIETIRGHSHKLKYKDGSRDPETKLSSMQEPVSGKSSRWKRIASLTKRSTPLPTRSQSVLSERHQGTRFSTRACQVQDELSRTPDWIAIKNIFPSGTDYLCDALYAHLIAYNYITSLCPRGSLIAAPRSALPKPRSTQFGRSFDETHDPQIEFTPETHKIPRKAASLLGLQNGPYVANTPSQSTMSPSNRIISAAVRKTYQPALRGRKSLSFIKQVRIEEPGFVEQKTPCSPEDLAQSLTRSNSNEYSGQSMFGDIPPSNTTSTIRDDHISSIGSGGGEIALSAPTGEQALRELRLGLARCVARLVATLRLTGCGPEMSVRAGQGPLDPRAAQEIDPLFLRALCEIVRCAEGN